MNKYKDDTDMLVSALIADETVYAGGKINTRNMNYFLKNAQSSIHFWSLSLYNFEDNDDVAMYIHPSGRLQTGPVLAYHSFRPAVLLNSNIEITSGDGRKISPYNIEA